MRGLITTDLDGCLFNHDDYSVDGAPRTLLYIKERAFPFIMTARKTRPEVERLQQILSLEKPLKPPGVGDRANDALLLAAMDIPTLILHHEGSYEQLDVANLKKVPWPGSRGWGGSAQEVLYGLA